MFRAAEILTSVAGDTGLIARCSNCQHVLGFPPPRWQIRQSTRRALNAGRATRYGRKCCASSWDDSNNRVRRRRATKSSDVYETAEY